MKAEESSSLVSSLWGYWNLLFSHMLAIESWFLALWHERMLLDSWFGSSVTSHTAAAFKKQTKIVMGGMFPWAPLIQAKRHGIIYRQGTYGKSSFHGSAALIYAFP